MPIQSPLPSPFPLRSFHTIITASILPTAMLRFPFIFIDTYIHGACIHCFATTRIRLSLHRGTLRPLRGALGIISE